MTRPPSAPGFAQFFPTAPKVRAEAEGRGDREPSRPKTNGVDSSRDHPADSDPRANGVGVASSHGRISSDAPHGHIQARVDENESPPGDIPGTVDSTSSHASTTSSVFSARPAATSASSHYPTASTTPLPSKESPSTSVTVGPPKADMPPSAPSDRATRPPSHAAPTFMSNNHTLHNPSTIERVPAQDPSPSVKGIKCTFDPLLERLRNKTVSRSAKPVYKEFGLVRTYNTFTPAEEGGGKGREGGGRRVLCVNSELIFG